MDPDQIKSDLGEATLPVKSNDVNGILHYCSGYAAGWVKDASCYPYTWYE